MELGKRFGHEDMLCQQIVLKAVLMSAVEDPLPVRDEALTLLVRQLSGLWKLQMPNQQVLPIGELVRPIPDNGHEALLGSVPQRFVPVLGVPEYLGIRIGVTLKESAESEF